jgi:hypothetical protein
MGILQAEREVEGYSTILFVDDDIGILGDTMSDLYLYHGCKVKALECKTARNLPEVTAQVAVDPAHTIFVDQFYMFHDQGVAANQIIDAAIAANPNTFVYEYSGNSKHPFSSHTRKVLPTFARPNDDGSQPLSIYTLGRGNRRMISQVDQDVSAQIAAADLLNLRITDAFQFAQELSRNPNMGSWEQIAALWPDMLPDVQMDRDIFNALGEEQRGGIIHSISMMVAYQEIRKGGSPEYDMQMSKIRLLLQPLL